MSFFSISRRLWHVLFTSIFTVSRIAYEKIYTSEKEARCCIEPFWYRIFWHMLLTCEMPYTFSLRALVCLHIDTPSIPTLPSWSFLELQIGLQEESPLLFSLFFCKSHFSSEIAASANRAKQHWMRAPWVSWWGVLSA